MASYPSSENCNSLHETKHITTLKREIFSFVWNIDQFGEFMDRKYELLSPAFIPETSDGTKWKLMVFPENVYPEGVLVAVRVLRAWDDDRSCSAKYTISIIDNNGKIFQQHTREKVFRHHLDSDGCRVISNKALKEKHPLQNGTLIIACKMDLMFAKNLDDKFSESQTKVSLPTNNLSYAYQSTGSVEYEKNINNLSDFNNLLQLSAERNVDDSENLKSGKSLELLSDDFKSLYMNKTESDITVRTDDGEIRAHKAILMTRSDYFKRQQMSPYGRNEIYVPGIKSITLDAILYYLYTGQLRHLTLEFALDLLVACNTFSLKQLQNLIQNYLKTQITVNNVTDIFQISKELHMDILKNCALKFVSANHSEVAKTEKWNRMMRNDPHAAGEVLLTVASFQKYRKQ